MPTGFTYKIADGRITTLPEYMTEAIYGFGVMINYRDTAESNRPKFDINTKAEDIDIGATDIDYHLKKIAHLVDECGKLMILDDEGLKKFYEGAIAGEKARQQKMIDQARDTQWNYVQMRVQVLAWKPQTTFLNDLKEFMIKQLEVSMDGDSDPSTVLRYAGTIQSDPETWRDDTVRKLREDMKYHAEELDRAKTRFNQRKVSLGEFLAEYRFLLRAGN